MAILVGAENYVNEKMLKQIKQLIDSKFILYSCDLSEELNKLDGHKNYFFINLMDIDRQQEDALLQGLKSEFPESKFIAIHAFIVEHMVNEVLNRGYDDYLPIFEFAERLPLALYPAEMD